MAAVLSEYVLLGQGVQALLSVTVLNFPATHSSHVPVSDILYPGWHLQSVTADDKTLLTEKFGQFNFWLSLQYELDGQARHEKFDSSVGSNTLKYPSKHVQFCMCPLCFIDEEWVGQTYFSSSKQ